MKSSDYNNNDNIHVIFFQFSLEPVVEVVLHQAGEKMALDQYAENQIYHLYELRKVICYLIQQIQLQ